ncbi:hypothetical protein F4805DRAFT_410734 [Annulohypoxylon moriforme]|nr:hypothetical protein F4805DRAFT_410734 [Annulohypoxylon moriforme]
MRLVNREFSVKMAGCFMKQIVISFGPQQTMKLAGGAARLNNLPIFDMAQSILESGLFQAFAPKLQCIGFAIELSEAELASPHPDDLDETILRSLEVYQKLVPPEKRRRQAQTPLWKATQALETSHGVSCLLNKADQVQELALSCDGGLGYLQGPDVNPFQPPGRLPVFSNHNAVQMTEDKDHKIFFKELYMREVLEHHLAIAGVNHADLEENSLLEQRLRAPLPLSRHPEMITRPDVKVIREDIRLQPDQLTKCQKWYMFRHMTAQRAMINSFMSTMLDNGIAFTMLTKLNLARIPGFHLESLCRDDFWASIPQVEHLALGVIPDWRSLEAKPEHEIFVEQVYPADVIPKVFHLLKNYIGKQPNIKRLHFEWHCGGEFAAGVAHRGHHVLPAPFIAQHRMVIDSSRDNLLIMPYLSHLSLKNCWFAPNVFYRIMKIMSGDHGLASLELESVSLCGPPYIQGRTPNTDTPPDEVQIPREDDPSRTYILKKGLPLSWSHVIDSLSPVQTICETIDQRLKGSAATRMKKGNRLRRLVFKSCGYVDVPDDRFISSRRHRFMRPEHPLALFGVISDHFLTRLTKTLSMEQFLQISTDRHLAYVLAMIDPSEKLALEKVYGFQTGWEGIYDEATIKAAQFDDVSSPGVGRFSGTIERVPDVVSDDDDELQDYVIPTTLFEEGYPDDDGLEQLMMEREQQSSYAFPGFLDMQWFLGDRQMIDPDF